jgi:hypothetical protein
MATKLPFESYVEQLGVALLDRKDVKAVMMAKDEFGNVAVTLVEGIEDSHKVRFGMVERCSRTLTRCAAQSS